MQIEMKFTAANGQRTLPVPTGTLIIRRVPGFGLMGMHRPHEGRTQTMVPSGKFRCIADTESALIDAWRSYVGLNEIRSF